MPALRALREQERVPDSVLREADEIILVDVSPEVLRERLRAGKIYSRDKIEQALHNFFTTENLSVLREVALRHVAETVEHSQFTQPLGVKERVAVAITPTANASRLIRRAARISQRLSAELHVVFVRRQRLSREQERVPVQRLLTESLDGSFHQLAASQPAEALIGFIQDYGISQLVMGTSLRNRWQELWSGSIIQRVLRNTRSGRCLYYWPR